MIEPYDGKTRVLVIDDEEWLREVVEEALVHFGMEVFTAEDGERGLELFNENPHIEVIVTDLMMPKMNGLELLETVKQKDPLVEVIFLTGHGSIDTALEAIKKGAYDYLQKPVSMEEISLTVERALERRHLYDEQKRSAEQLRKLVEQLDKRNKDLESALKELHETQVQLLQSEKLSSLGQMAAGVAHEINNPIGYVRANLQTMQKYAGKVVNALSYISEQVGDNDADGALADDIRDKLKKEKVDRILGDFELVLNESLEGTSRVQQIVKDLGQFSRNDSEGERAADINKGIRSTLNIVKGKAKKVAEVILELDEDLPKVQCNMQQINQVVMNLIVNATQAIEEPPGKVWIRSRKDGGSVKIEVEDNGMGMPPEVVEKIFDPFFTTKPVGEGTGLGLSISYRIIQNHQGSIEVDSISGKGTLFTITLPIAGRQDVAE